MHLLIKLFDMDVYEVRSEIWFTFDLMSEKKPVLHSQFKKHLNVIINEHI